MPIAICVTRCTYGKPPKFYAPGDTLVYTGEKCPKCFKPKSAVAAKAEKEESPDAGKTLGEAASASGSDKQKDIENKTAPDPCTVEQLAEKLGVEIDVIKEASGRTRKNEKLKSEEVSAITAAVKKAQAGSGESVEAGSGEGGEEESPDAGAGES